MYGKPWLCRLTKVATIWTKKKNREKKITGIRFVLPFEDELADGLGDDAPAALALLNEGKAGPEVKLSIPCGAVILELSDVEDGDMATVRMLDKMRAVARPGEDGPELEVTANFTHYDDGCEDVLDFMHRHMGAVEVQMLPRQEELPGTNDEAVKGSIRKMRRALGPDGSMTLESGGKSVTLTGK